MSNDPKSILAGDKTIAAKFDAGAWSVTVDGAPLASFRQIEAQASDLTFSVLDVASPPSVAPVAPGVPWISAALYPFFGTDRALKRVRFELEGRAALRTEILAEGFGVADPQRPDAVTCHRTMFWQHHELWLTNTPGGKTPLTYKMTNGIRHPARPLKRPGVLYRRHVPEYGVTVSLSTIDVEKDLALFHKWMNDPRVSFFWELEDTEEKHAEYIRTLLADEHTHPILIAFDDEPFAYTEVYWGKEDRLGPYYEADDYDRGFHALVGEQKYRGEHRVAAWMPSVLHYMFLDDPRTKRIVGEPRASNDKLIGYLLRCGFYRQKEFNFPHKRAAMTILEREAFFDQEATWWTP